MTGLPVVSRAGRALAGDHQVVQRVEQLDRYVFPIPQPIFPNGVIRLAHLIVASAVDDQYRELQRGGGLDGVEGVQACPARRRRAEQRLLDFVQLAGPDRRGRLLDLSQFLAFLVGKITKAARLHPAKSLLVGGGVACNQALRMELTRRCQRLGLKAHFPSPELCTDNPAMIASLGYFKLKMGQAAALELDADASLKLG